jgi:probable rRNA maturation factor
VLRHGDAWNGLRASDDSIATAAEAAFEAADDDDAPAPCEMTVLLTDDREMRDLNRRWRGKDAATNVLSFPAGDEPEGIDGPRQLGDIVLAAETIAREAEAQGITLTDHLSHLVVHGTLHLLGYDHEDDAEAERMEALETTILAGLGIADPYAQTPGDAPRAETYP